MSSTSVAPAVAAQVVKAPIWPAASHPSSVSRTTSNHIHSHQLKKQKSLIDSVIVTNSLNNSSSIMSTRRAAFQKQLSVDQVNLTNSVRTWTNSALNNNLNSNNSNNSSRTAELRAFAAAAATTNASIGINNKRRQQNVGKNE